MWESYLASPPPPPGISPERADQKASDYQKQAIVRMKRAGYAKLAYQYRVANSSGTASASALKAVFRSQRTIEKLCGWDPYDYDYWARTNPMPPPSRDFR